MNKKDQKTINDSEREGIPIFVLTAKDKLSLKAIKEYFTVCSEESCASEHLIGINDRIEEFKWWQENNPDKVKLPD